MNEANQNIDLLRPQPLKRPNVIREIRIEQLNHGYIVRIDCHSFAIESKKDLIARLSGYIDNPEEVEKKWFEGNLFHKP